MVDPDIQALVIVGGTSITKAGFSGDDAPRCVFPTIVGTLKNPGIMVGLGQKDYFVGDEAHAKRGILRIRYPMEHGQIKRWDDIERLFHHTYYNEMSVAPEEHPVLLVDNQNTSKSDREKLVKLKFESFNNPAIYIAQKSVLALYSVGKVVGIVCNSGSTVTDVVPVFEGSCLDYAVDKKNNKIGGDDVTRYLIKLIIESGYSVTGNITVSELTNDIKEKMCYVASDYEKEIEKSKTTKLCEREYTLLDGNKLKFNDVRFKAPEILFKPSMIKYEMPGIHERIFNTIKRCNIDIHNDLFHNIVLCGGNMDLHGIGSRIKVEIEKLNQKENRKITIRHPNLGYGVNNVELVDHKYGVWIGGSILSSLTSFSNMWLTASEYDEYGSSIIHRKCW